MKMAHNLMTLDRLKTMSGQSDHGGSARMRKPEATNLWCQAHLNESSPAFSCDPPAT
jgi:hypothetical protein